MVLAVFVDVLGYCWFGWGYFSAYQCGWQCCFGYCWCCGGGGRAAVGGPVVVLAVVVVVIIVVVVVALVMEGAAVPLSMR
jgi:hypothetical protein